MSVRPNVRAAFAGLIDYAGLFPPAGLLVEPALAEYATAKAGAYAWTLDRFIVPASRLDDLAKAARGTPLSLSLILDVRSDGLGWFEAVRTRLAAAQATLAANPTLELAAIEVPLHQLRALRDTYDGAIGQFAALASSTGVRDIPTYLEAPRDTRWLDMLPATMTVLARHGFGAKVRCGGASPEAYPSCDELGAFVRAAVAASVRFKATAGLHHPVRHYDAANGCNAHGFLNLLAATLIARDDEPSRSVEAVLGEEDAQAFSFGEGALAYRDRHYDLAALTAARAESFNAYGSCSFDEPIADLEAMGILAEASA
jgi:hypothetical protein